MTKSIVLAVRVSWTFVRSSSRAVIGAFVYRNTELPPYGPLIRIPSAFKGIFFLFLGLFCLLYGAAFAIFVPFFATPVIVPLVALALLALWSLPQTTAEPTKLLPPLFFLFFVGLLLWPSYLAIAIPGLPRVTVTRLVAIPLTLCLLFCLSISTEFLNELKGVVRQHRFPFILVSMFTLLQVISVLFSVNKSASINVLLTVITSWVAIYTSGIVVLNKPGRTEKLCRLLCNIAVVLALLGCWEQVLHRVPWQGHVPPFLKINDPVVDRILAGVARQGKDHRVQGTFTTSLVFSEYLAMTVPFLLCFAFGKYDFKSRVGALVSLPLVLTAILLTQARTGLLGFCLSILIFPIASIFLYWYNNKSSFFARTVVVLSPFAAVIGFLTALVVPAIRIRLLGGGTEQASNQGRTVQIHMGIPKVISHPWGHGVGQGAEALGWTNAAGMLSIDSYPLRLALEYGILGIALWFAIFVVTLLEGGRCLLRGSGEDDEAQLLLPVMISLFSYFAMKINFAQEDNNPVLYALFAIMAVLTARSKVSASTSKAA